MTSEGLLSHLCRTHGPWGWLPPHSVPVDSQWRESSIKIGDQVGSISHEGTQNTPPPAMAFPSNPATWRPSLNIDLSVNKPIVKLRGLPVQAEHKCRACWSYFRIS